MNKNESHTVRYVLILVGSRRRVSDTARLCWGHEMDPGTVYILQLKHRKYYVGHTSRQHGERYNEHFRDRGAEWTKRYKPVIVLRQFAGTLADEDETTLEMMEQHGWTNVRGGCWCKVKMNKPPKILLRREVTHRAEC